MSFLLSQTVNALQASLYDVNGQVSTIVNNAPSDLSTLNQLASALNDDANFASTVANQIALTANTTDLIVMLIR